MTEVAAPSLMDMPLVQARVPLIPYSFAKEKQLLPIEQREECLVVATTEPLPWEVTEALHAFVGLPITWQLCTQEALEEALRFCFHKEEHAAHLVEAFASNASVSSGEVYDLLESREGDSPVVAMLDAMLLEAIQQGASDIHFEPQESSLCIRYRVDGVLQKRHCAPRDLLLQMLTRIKVLSRLDIAEQRLPQDGRIRLKVGGRDIDFRVSTLPVSDGERIVLRILDKGNLELGLHHLGMPDEVRRKMERYLRRTEGIILVTGPTGSGKTTTLYSALRDIDATELNIMTVEDPVEYKLGSVAQMSVNPKIQLSFATGLRHILRQDPDVIMVGEIRDPETAQIAVQAALTGHLVLSTLHTNDAPSALTRLVDMGIPPYLLSSSVIGVLAQRLVRSLCPHCVTPTTWTGPLGQTLFHGVGCPHCFGSGYRGRCAVYELMTMNDPIREQLIKKPEARQLKLLAEAGGMVSLRQAATDLAVQGKTSWDEVLRATRGLED